MFTTTDFFHDSWGSPAAVPAKLRASYGFCVGAQISQTPSRYIAVQLQGSIGEASTNGASYTASSVFAAVARAASTSPSFRRTRPGGPEVSRSSRSRRVRLLSAAAGPGSQRTSSARRPFIAAHVDVATTATPFATMIGRPDFRANRSAGSSTTFRTPGTASARDASNRATFPPNVGERSITAWSIPGRRTSRP